MAYNLEIEGLVSHKHKLEAENERLREELDISAQAVGVSEWRRQECLRLQQALLQIQGVCADYKSAETKFIDGIAKRALTAIK